VISDAAIEETDSVCVEAMRIFVRNLAGNAATLF
jgi:hypothetical protein